MSGSATATATAGQDAAESSSGSPPQPARRASVIGLLRLAAPIMLARAGILIMVFVDFVMLGRVGVSAVAPAALGTSLFIVVLVAGIGLIQGVLVLSAQARGRGDDSEAAAVFWRGVPWALSVGAAGAALTALSGVAFHAIGHRPELADEAGWVALAVAPSVPLSLLFLVASFALEAARRPGPALWAMVAANGVNAGLNALLIYGLWGFPELGALGSALATTGARAFLAVVLIAVVIASGVARRPSRSEPVAPRSLWGPGGWRAGAPMRRIGAAAGVSLLMESGFYATLTQLAGFLGPTAIAAFAVLLNFQSIVFMAAVGLGSATAVVVGNAWGAGDPIEARRAGAIGVSATFGLMGLGALFAVVSPTALAALYTDDAVLAAVLTMLFLGLAPVMLFDGAQMVRSLSVRALGDAWGATRLFAIAYWGVGAPLAAMATFGISGVLPGLGVWGLLLAALAASITSFALQSWRFAVLVRRHG